MAKKKKQQHRAANAAAQSGEKDSPITLKELLGADVLGKLRAQSDELKQQEAGRREEARRQEEERKKQEQKARENDFAYLLENSDQSWGKYKS